MDWYDYAPFQLIWEETLGEGQIYQVVERSNDYVGYCFEEFIGDAVLTI